MPETYTDWIAMITAILIILLFIGGAILAVIYDANKTIEQNKYIKSLNEHDKAVIATYKAINGRIRKHEHSRNG